MARYLSRRSVRTPQSRLTPDRYQYLSINQAEPNLGDPPGNQLPIGQQYMLVSLAEYPGERYWVSIPPGQIELGITVRDEGQIIGGNAGIGSITQLNFVGSGVSVTGIITNGLGIATITIDALSVILEPTDSIPRYIGFTSIRGGGICTSTDIAPELFPLHNTLVFSASTTNSLGLLIVAAAEATQPLASTILTA